jgi:hypothetical protein
MDLYGVRCELARLFEQPWRHITKRTATAVAGIQQVASAFGAAVQLKGSSRVLRNTFVQHLMVAELLQIPNYSRNRSSARLDGVRRKRNGCRKNYGSRLQERSVARGSLTVPDSFYEIQGLAIALSTSALIASI